MSLRLKLWLSITALIEGWIVLLHIYFIANSDEVEFLLEMGM